jgi:hypothetical protein
MLGANGDIRSAERSLEKRPEVFEAIGMHAALDAAVIAAYGFSAKKDLLDQLLQLNLTVAARIASNQAVVAPGIPPNYPDPAKLLTEDCIRPN